MNSIEKLDRAALLAQAASAARSVGVAPLERMDAHIYALEAMVDIGATAHRELSALVMTLLGRVEELEARVKALEGFLEEKQRA